MLLLNRINSIFLILLIGSLLGCHKKEFLDEKPATDLFVPSTLEDFRVLLDNEVVMSETPVLGELSADNYYLPYSFWETLSSTERNGHIWAGEIYNGEGNIGDWNKPYQQVFYANVVLDALPKVMVTGSNEQEWNNIKGVALFIRAYAFYNLAQVFASAYDNNTSITDLGIPLRLTPIVNVPSVRATVQQTYDQILQDLTVASRLLSDVIDFSNPNRPTKPAAMAMLARTYLSMRMYEKAGAYADSSLQLYNTLIAYDSIEVNAILPFKPSNKEALYQSKMLSSTSVIKGIIVPDCIVDSTLYQSYTNNDLRGSVFYSNSSGFPNLKGSYNGTVFAFSGLATDEMYLVRAECFARAGNKDAAMNDLNTLLQKRWKAGTFIPYTATDPADALQIILKERRKELPFRGLRWTDIRRLNKEGYEIILTRYINNQTYQLQPNHQRYVLPIPSDVIAMSGIPQNPR